MLLTRINTSPALFCTHRLYMPKFSPHEEVGKIQSSIDVTQAYQHFTLLHSQTKHCKKPQLSVNFTYQFRLLEDTRTIRQKIYIDARFNSSIDYTALCINLITSFAFIS